MIVRHTVDLGEPGTEQGTQIHGRYRPLSAPGILEVVLHPNSERLEDASSISTVHLQLRRPDVDRLIRRLTQLKELFDANPAGGGEVPAGVTETEPFNYAIFDPLAYGDSEALDGEDAEETPAGVAEMGDMLLVTNIDQGEALLDDDEEALRQQYDYLLEHVTESPRLGHEIHAAVAQAYAGRGPLFEVPSQEQVYYGLYALYEADLIQRSEGPAGESEEE